MPLKNGRMNPQERTFATTFAETGNAVYAAKQAGYAHPHQRAASNLAKPAVQAEIRAQQLARLNNELLPLALDNIEAILKNPKASERGKIMAAKIVIDRTAGASDALGGKEPHEMSGDELQAAIDRLRREASDRAKPVQVVDLEPVNSQIEDVDKGVFD